VPLILDLHPEFGYVGSAPRIFRRLAVNLAFAAFGIAASVAVLMTNPESGPGTSTNPLDAMALAPAEALTETKIAQPARLSENGMPSAHETSEEGANTSQKTASIKSTCREVPDEISQGDCAPARVVRMRPPRAANERPLIAAVPIGHRNDPAVLLAPPSSPVEDNPSPTTAPDKSRAIPAPTETAVARMTPTDAKRADAAPAAELTPPAPAPTVTPKKPRPRVRQVQDDDEPPSRQRSKYSDDSDEPRSRQPGNYSYETSHGARSSSYGARSYEYLQSGYARLW
jgi:hypothetical protein